MEPEAARNFLVEISAVSHVDEQARGLVSGLFEIQLAVDFTLLFTVFESQMAPPFPADTRVWEDFEDWETMADARLGHFYDAEFVVTACDARAGQELYFPSWHGARGYGVGGHGRRYEPVNGVVFYTSDDQYEVLTADLRQFLHGSPHDVFEGRALDLQGRPVLDFLVDRLQTSRLVPDEMRHRLGLGQPPTRRTSPPVAYPS